MKFLKEIKEEKSARNKLRNFLVLLSRLLAMAFLIFAFAQPFLSKNETVKTGNNNVSIFIDNSNSMMALSEDVPLLDKAKKKAESIVNAYGPSDQFQIISHDLKGSQQRWINKENVIQAIEDIQLSPKVNNLANVYNKQKQSAQKEGNHIIYYLSDFQKSITDLPVEADTTIELNLLPFQSVKESNITIDSAWFESVVPSINQNNKLFVRLKNHSDEKRDDVRLSINHNGQNRPEGTINIGANSTKTDTINLLLTEAGWQKLEIKIDDYPIQFDDSYFISFNIKEKINILSIYNNQPDRYLTALFKGLNQFELDKVKESSIQYDKLKDYDLIILSELKNISTGLSGGLKTYVENGGNVLVFPSELSNLESYNNFLAQLNANGFDKWTKEERNVYKINTAEFTFSNVYTSTGTNLKLPTTKGNFTSSNFSSRGGEYLLRYRDGSNYVTKYRRGKGNLYVCASPLDKDINDLSLNAEVFVPMLYKLSFSSSQGDKLAYTIGEDNFTEVKNSSSSNEIIYKIKGGEEFIPGQTNLGTNTLIQFNNMITESGFFTLDLNDEMVKGLAFNYDRKESNLDYFSPDELKGQYKDNANILDNTLNADLGAIIKEKDRGTVLWRWCLIFALIFLAIETLLLRFWKL